MRTYLRPLWIAAAAALLVACGGGSGISSEVASLTEHAAAKPGGGGVGTTFDFNASSTNPTVAGAYVSRVTVVSARKVKGNTEYSYVVEVTAGGQSTGAVNIALLGVGAGATIVDGASALDGLIAGATSSSTNTITVLQTNAKTFNPATWTWALNGENAVPLACAEGVVALPDVNTWCADRPVPFVGSRAASFNEAGEEIAQETTVSGATATISGSNNGSTSTASSTTVVGSNVVSATSNTLTGYAGSYWKDRFTVSGTGSGSVTIDLTNVGVGPFRTAQEFPGESIYCQVNIYRLSDGQLYASGQFAVYDHVEAAQWNWSSIGTAAGGSANITPYVRGQNFSVSMEGFMAPGSYEVHVIAMANAGSGVVARSASVGSIKLSVSVPAEMSLQSHTGLLNQTSPGVYRYQ